MADLPDLSKLSLYTPLPAFKNNKKYEGSFIIDAPLNGAVTFQDHLIILDQAPDLLQMEFKGPINTTFAAPAQQRPANSWVDPTDYDYFTAESYDPYWFITPSPIDFILLTEVIGNQVNVRSAMFKQYSDNPTYVPITVYYRITDYSVF